MDFTTITGSIIAALGGGGTVGGLVVWLVKRNLEKESREREALQSKVARLETEKIGELKTQIVEVKAMLSDHVNEDKTGEILTELRLLSGNVAKMDDKLDRVCERSVGQEAQIHGANQFIGNLDRSLQAHKSDHTLHRR